MKVKLEAIKPGIDSSFAILLTPKLNEIFYWHFHPEYEIVYVEAETGVRHVGDHISRYQGSDLVFIGPNIPHLNFDYGVRTEYRKVVVQLNADFLGAELWQAPELAAIADLFSRARSGLSFYGETKAEVGRDLARLADLPPFDRLLLLLRVFQRLAGSAEVTRLHGEPVAGAYDLDEQRRLKRLTQFVAECYSRRIELREAA